MEGGFVDDICDGRHNGYGGNELEDLEPSVRRVVVADSNLIDNLFLNDSSYKNTDF